MCDQLMSRGTSMDQPLQIEIFENIDKRYTNSVGLWDMAPWTVLYTDSEKRVGGRYLGTIERMFNHNGAEYRLALRPARLRNDDNKTDIEEYPQEREQLVELAIRQLATNRRRIKLEDDDTVSMTFTLYELRTELERTGHAVRYEDIRKAISILHGTQIQISRASEDGDGDEVTTVFSSTIFPTVIRRASETEEKISQNTYCVHFNKLIVDALRMLEFRQMSYETLMSLGPISRWVYKWLCHELFHGVSPEPRIQVLRATDIIRNCGIGDYSRLRDALDRVSRSIEDLKKHGLIEDIEHVPEFEPTRGRARKIDVVYSVTLTKEFLYQAQRAASHYRSNHAEYTTLAGERPHRFVVADKAKRASLRKRRDERALAERVMKLPL
jgi:hypothetical protein